MTYRSYFKLNFGDFCTKLNIVLGLSLVLAITCRHLEGVDFSNNAVQKVVYAKTHHCPWTHKMLECPCQLATFCT